MLNIKELRDNFEYPDAKTIEIQEQEVFVKQYLPMADKYQLINIIINTLKETDGLLSPLLSNILFETEMISAYSSLDLEEESSNFFKTYDILNVSGIAQAVINAIPVEEYEYVLNMYQMTLANINEYNKSAGGAITTALGMLPGLAEQAENFNFGEFNKAADKIKPLLEEQHI